VINHIVAKRVAKDADCRGFPCINRFESKPVRDV